MTDLSLAYHDNHVSGRLEHPVQIIQAASTPSSLSVSDVSAAIESAGLPSRLRQAKRITLVVNDHTRKAGMATILQALLPCLPAGIRPKLVIAYGLHAAQSDVLTKAALGADILDHVDLVHHQARNPETLLPLGTLPTGHSLSVARDVADCDVRVLLGGIGFHYYAGFSGGRKSVLPGVADETSIIRNHLRVLDPQGPNGRAAGCGPGRTIGNPVDEEMRAGLRLLLERGETLLVNGVVSNGSLIDLAVAQHEHVNQAHVEACERFAAIASVAVEDGFDAVIASAGGYPYDVSMYQAHKAYDNAFRALRMPNEAGPKPMLIFVAACGEGLGHPRFSHWLDHPTREVHYEAIRNGYEIVGQTSLAVRDKGAMTNTLAVTDLSEETCAKLGMVKVASLQAALNQIPVGARVGYMPTAAQVLPIRSMTAATKT